jgi:hypothetical protein
VALVTVLLLTFILLVLTVSFLYFAERNYRFAGLQERQNQAYFLAISGLEYYRARPEEFLEQKTVIRYVPKDSTTNYFEVTLEDDGRLTCKGVLIAPLSGMNEPEALERTIIVPEGSVEKMYDTSQDL